MRKLDIRWAVLSALGIAMVVGVIREDVTAADKDPKYTIKEVMEQAHKSGLLKKVSAGTADKADREKLAELYKALTENKPPKGELDEWKKSTAVLKKAAEEAVNDANAGKKLKVNCAACHGKFKG